MPIERRTRRAYGCLPSSAFRSASVCLPLGRLPLADLHPVVPITVTHSATTPPPTSPPRAGSFAPHCWAERCGSSPVPIADQGFAPRTSVDIRNEIPRRTRALVCYADRTNLISPVPRAYWREILLMCEQSVAAPYTPDALWSNPGQPPQTARQASSRLGQACQPVSPGCIYGISDGCSSRQHRSQG